MKTGGFVDEKRQTPAQRVANPVWLRGQIRELVKSCDANIKEDLKLANQTSGDVSERYRASLTSIRHWKRQLERILRGKTANEDLRDFLQQEDVSQ